VISVHRNGSTVNISPVVLESSEDTASIGVSSDLIWMTNLVYVVWTVDGHRWTLDQATFYSGHKSLISHFGCPIRYIVIARYLQG